jgi:transketolase
MRLRHFRPDDVAAVRALVDDDIEVSALVADMSRLNTLYAIMRAGSGHIGSSFSSIDIVTWLHLGPLGDPDAGVYFSSKGHDAPGLYAVLTLLGRLDFEKLHALRRLGGLPGHPDVGTPGMPANTGSLGMGIAKAKGMAEARRLQGDRLPIYVMTGDGELQEGQNWESLSGAVNRGLGEITLIVDHNRIQSDTWVRDVSDLGDLESKFGSFGWRVARCDGHDVIAVKDGLEELGKDEDVPGVLIADTVKGKGVSFMEGIPAGEELYHFHSGAPDVVTYRRAVDELLERIHEAVRLLAPARGAIAPVEVDVDDRIAPSGRSMVKAYGESLVQLAAEHGDIVALDADLALDTGLLPFAARFPDRFVECGIAEQDMVSQAGGMALRGLLPVVHSFACFLSSRPNEQIYTNATEHTKVVYVGSLAGLVPGGPGHSHQCVRDISALGGVPGLLLAEPGHPDEVGPLLDVCLNEVPESIYLRLVTVPVEVPFDLPADHRPVPGRGTVVRDGNDVVVIAAGPWLLAEAWHAAEALAASGGPSVRLVALPWLNRVDTEWLADVTDGIERVVTLDNHYIAGGQGQAVLAAMATFGRATYGLQLGVREVPVCGTNAEVLRHHRLDAAGLAEDIGAFVGAR